MQNRRIERFIESYGPAIMEDNLEDFETSDIRKNIEGTPGAIGRTLTYIADNFSVPLEATKNSKEPNTYTVGDFEELERKLETMEDGNPHELLVSESPHTPIDEDLELQYQELEDELKKEFGGEETTEIELQCFLIGKLLEEDKYSHIQAGLYTGKITEHIQDQEFIELSDNLYRFKDNLEY